MVNLPAPSSLEVTEHEAYACRPGPAATSRLRGSTPRLGDCLICTAGLKHLDQTGYGPLARRDGCTCRECPPGRSTRRTSGRAACRRPARLFDAWPPEAVLHPDPQTRNRSDSSNGFAFRYNPQLRRHRIRCRVRLRHPSGTGAPKLWVSRACSRRDSRETADMLEQFLNVRFRASFKCPVRGALGGWSRSRGGRGASGPPGRSGRPLGGGSVKRLGGLSEGPPR